ncbi:hypothetical protein MRB53_025395 [Persea americana]|uniref:Uncharacterized protein n=1 Tax=Persea americana TaxID=3435 RepID=A0ACC2LF48_PERAE|nr:hypothetical protein MRB53_025395 [Persea americana]
MPWDDQKKKWRMASRFSTAWYALRTTPTQLTTSVNGQELWECVHSSVLFSVIATGADTRPGMEEHQPSIANFGADQFDEEDPKEGGSKDTFYSYFYLALNLGGLFSNTVFGYLENEGCWALCFWMSSGFAFMALVLFLCGTPRYRQFKPGGNPIIRVCQVVIAAMKKWMVEMPPQDNDLYEASSGRERANRTSKMGAGLIIAVMAMISTGIVESYRLKYSKEDCNDCHNPSALSTFWQIPQYVLIGASEVFMNVGQLAFFNGQAPDRLKSFGSALCMTSMSLGNYVSSLLVTIVMKISTEDNKPGWIPGNLNMGHIERFYFLSAGLTTPGFDWYVLRGTGVSIWKENIATAMAQRKLAKT